MRATEQLRARMDESARLSGRSLSAEVEYLIDRVFTLKDIEEAVARGENERGVKWKPMESAPEDGTRLWLTLDNGQVVIGSWVKNPPKSYRPGHWRTNIGTCSDQSELGNPVAWSKCVFPEVAEGFGS